MRELSKWRPKPLLPVAGHPLIAWSIRALQHANIKRVGVNTFHLGAQLREALNQYEQPQLIITEEQELQGTGGGVRELLSALDQGREAPTPGLLVLNGDAWFDFELNALTREHLAEPAREATLALRLTTPDDPFGRVGLDAQGHVVRVAELKGPRAHEEVSVAAFLGAQMVGRAVLDVIPEGPCDLFRGALKERLEAGALIGAHLVSQEAIWCDVGTPERYLELHMMLLERLARGELSENLTRLIPPHTLTRSTRGGGLLLCMEGSEVNESKGEGDDEGVNIARGAWLYPHAQLSGSMSVESLVMWPHTHTHTQTQIYTRTEGSEREAQAPKPSARAVLTPYGEVSAMGALLAGAVGAPR